MRRLVGLVAALAFTFAFAAAAEAQIKNRWRIEWKNSKPKTYSHYDKFGNLTNYWYFTYELTNPTDDRVPILVDIMMYIESSKELQHDVKRVDVETVRRTFEKERPDERPYESERYGRYYSNVIYPEVEYKIIEEDLKLGNRLRDVSDPTDKDLINGVLMGTEGVKEESIRSFKEKHRYLNPREMRQKAFLQPKETVHGIAIFKSVDPRANVVEIHVSGLVDIFKITQVTEDDLLLEYENRVLIITYEFRGDPFEREKDVLLISRPARWAVKRIGPIASKDTIENLVKAMVETIKKEQEWADAGLKPEDIERERGKHGITRQDVNVVARTFRLAVDKDFGYDFEKSVLENKQAIWRMHEWWTTYKGKLIFDYAKNKFVVDESELPGKKNVDKEK